jgi:hypothetical protein
LVQLLYQSHTGGGLGRGVGGTDGNKTRAQDEAQTQSDSDFHGIIHFHSVLQASLRPILSVTGDKAVFGFRANGCLRCLRTSQKSAFKEGSSFESQYWRMSKYHTRIFIREKTQETRKLFTRITRMDANFRRVEICEALIFTTACRGEVPRYGTKTE